MPDDDLWVIDTSSIIEVRRLVPRNRQHHVYRELGNLVTTDRLFFPRQVFDEIKRWTDTNTSPVDLPYDWAHRNLARATQHGERFDTLRKVLEQVSDVLDNDRPGAEEADPFVLTLAKHLLDEGQRVTVITEERKDRPDKMSMNTACGILRLPCLPLEAFLVVRGIWRRSE